MVSDDTEHACMVAQALIASGSDPDRFERDLARRLRFWFAAMPAGIGLATLRSCLRLWLGVSPSRSGVFSAGNGPAMRSVVLGAAVKDRDLLLHLIERSTRITHADPKAFHGAAAVALAAQLATRGLVPDPDNLRILLNSRFPDPQDEFGTLIRKVASSIAGAEPTNYFARTLGLQDGVTGYMYHTVPVALHAWLSFPRDLEGGLSAVISCGGDTDSTAAIVGGLIGCGVGVQGLPASLIAGIWEWPRTVKWMSSLADSTANALREPQGRLAPSLPFPAVLARNAVFTGIILTHALRRMLPPY